MTDVEVKFFDEYKRLDAFCRQAYGGEKGITDYLYAMEEYFPQSEQALPRWERDYRTIKRLRHIRNLIGHQTSGSGCTEADYLELQKLHLRFLRSEDPLAQLEKAEAEAEKAAAAERQAAARYAAERRSAQSGGIGHMAAVILLLMIMALAAAGIAAIILAFA